MSINKRQLALRYETDISLWIIVFDEKRNESQQTYEKIKERVTFLLNFGQLVSYLN